MKQIKSLALGWIIGILATYVIFGIIATFSVKDAFVTISLAVVNAAVAIPLFHIGELDWKTLLIIAAGATIGAAVKFKYDEIQAFSQPPEWKEYMGDFKEESNMTEGDDLTLYKYSSFLATGNIELLDMEPIYQKYPELPQGINGYLIYPPLDIKHTKFNMLFGINEEFKAQVDALPSTDLIVYFDPKAHDIIDDAVTLYMLTHQYTKG